MPRSRHKDHELSRNTACGEHTKKVGLFPFVESCLQISEKKELGFFVEVKSGYISIKR